MDAAFVIEKLTGLRDNLQRRPMEAHYICKDITKLIEEFTRPHTGKSVPSLGKAKLRVIQRFAKECVKGQTYRRGLAGAFIAPDTGHITICDGFKLWASPKMVSDLPMVDCSQDELLKVKPLIASLPSEPEYPLPDLAHVKAEYKQAYANRPPYTKNFTHVITLEDGVLVNAQYLIRCMEMLGGVKTYKHGESMVSPLYMEADDGAYCILLPVRKSQ